MKPRHLAFVAVTQMLLLIPVAVGEDQRAMLGSEAVAAETQEEIRGTLGSIVAQAATDGDFEDVVDYLVQPDQTRFGSAKNEDVKALEDAAEQFRDAWKTKYGRQFSFGYFAGLGAKEQEEQIFTYGFSRGPDNKHVRVDIPSSHNLPAVYLNLVNEGTVTNAWRIDIPDSTSAVQFRDALVRELAAINSEMATLPVSERDAYRIVSHRLLKAFGPQAV